MGNSATGPATGHGQGQAHVDLRGPAGAHVPEVFLLFYSGSVERASAVTGPRKPRADTPAPARAAPPPVGHIACFSTRVPESIENRCHNRQVTTTAVDGHLPAALDRLNHAVTALADPAKGWIAGAVRLAPSLYDQLVADIPARATEQGRRCYSASTPVVHLDATDLRHDIDDTVRHWHPGTDTVDRLHRLTTARHRPQDVDRLDRHTADLQRWTAAIGSLLEPAHVKTVSAPCPACQATHVYRMKAGEQVRQPALQIIAADGCTCLACKTHWPPERYMLLAKIIGLDTPAGIVG